MEIIFNIRCLDKLKSTAANIVFAKGGVENIIELFVAFSRACFSTSHFFSNLVS